MRQEISCRIHHLDPLFDIGNSDMDMQSKDQQAAGDHLQFVNEQFITVAVVYLLLGPFRERMRRRGDDRHVLSFGQGWK